MSQYRRPGVYIEESLSTSPFETANAVAVALFVGLAAKGPPLEAVRVDSWSDYAQKFGAFEAVPWNNTGSTSTGRTLSTCAITSGDATVTVSGTTVTSGDVGRTVTGTGIPADTTILTVTDSTHFELSANATATNASVSLTLGTLAVPAGSGSVLSYLPYAVYSYYQSGGRAAYVVRAAPVSEDDRGVTASAEISDGAATPAQVLEIEATGAGAWGNALSVIVQFQAASSGTPSRDIFSLVVMTGGNRVESFANLSMGGVEGTRPVATAINDTLAGSRYIRVTTADSTLDPEPGTVTLTGGVDPELPAAADLIGQGVTDAIKTVDGPLLVSFQPFQSPIGATVMPPAQSVSGLSDRGDIFMVWDGNPLREVPAGTSYTSNVMSRAASVGTDNSYAAIYAPWIIMPDPAKPGATIAVPPSGGVTGVMARIDATTGPWRTPAGIPASISSALTTEIKFTDTEQGELNYNNVNVIRSQVGSGICIMGGRTRKLWGPDRYIGARRTLIYLKETLRRSTQFAVFQNNDTSLWSTMSSTANRILVPMWQQGGLKGGNVNEAFFVRCDDTINTPQVIQSGEVRMIVGVALQYPAEFVVILITQFDSGGSLAVEGITA